MWACFLDTCNDNLRFECIFKWYMLVVRGWHSKMLVLSNNNFDIKISNQSFAVPVLYMNKGTQNNRYGNYCNLLTVFKTYKSSIITWFCCHSIVTELFKCTKYSNYTNIYYIYSVHLTFHRRVSFFYDDVRN